MESIGEIDKKNIYIYISKPMEMLFKNPPKNFHGHQLLFSFIFVINESSIIAYTFWC